MSRLNLDIRGKKADHARMATRLPIVPGEWYHCFNRGTDKRRIFESKKDYERFLLLLYVCNSTERIHVSDLYDRSLAHVLADATLVARRGEPLVDIGAYSLMPNHFHLVLKELTGKGIALFMQKVMTGYTMYFNKKNERTGALLAGTFKSKHLSDDRYFKKVIAYVHMNAAELFEPGWKQGKGNLAQTTRHVLEYPYSSLPAHMSRLNLDIKKDEVAGRIIGESIFEFYPEIPSIEESLKDAQEYYQEVAGGPPNVKV